MEKDNVPEMAFSAEEWLRYTRHVQLPDIGAAGQLRLKKSHVVVIGAGGLGSPVGLYLSAAGVGTLTIVDHDHVDLTNLQRQILFQQDDLQKNKADSAAANLSRLNSEISIKPLAAALDEDNSADILKNADIVIDCTDNFATRYIINDTCTQLEIPWLSASIRQFSGQISLFTKHTGCFRCLYPTAPNTVEDCNTNGVLGVLPGILGVFQANEAIKYLCGLATPLEGKVMLVNALTLEFQKMAFSKNPQCFVCNTSPETAKPKDHESVGRVNTISENMAGEKVSAVSASHAEQISADEFDLRKLGDTAVIVDVRSLEEHRCFNLGGVNVPLAELDDRSLSQFQNKSIICYCQSGKRSDTAARLFTKKGMHAVSLAGGIVDYLRQRR